MQVAGAQPGQGFQRNLGAELDVGSSAIASQKALVLVGNVLPVNLPVVCTDQMSPIQGTLLFYPSGNVLWTFLSHAACSMPAATMSDFPFQFRTSGFLGSEGITATTYLGKIW